MVSKLVLAEELLVQLHSNTILIFIATILLKLIFSSLLGPWKSNATCMAAFNNHQCLQVYFNSAKHVFSTSKKDHEKVVITQFDTGRWFYAPIYAKWLISCNFLILAFIEMSD